ncbi:FAD-dependent monooxygenase [uncultured Cocleimonas sp.]|uniref:FAD-dependent monooxygenase n=1 Tax=uncultured Cocleimonas sp. TaxID=1051587 RepID=UPI002619297F|nr:FAD-dependent monooxygenase [uncultured Cocleimonas sp.]
MSIVIVGAGLGGLTTALFLEKLGISFQIYEQTDQIKPVGAGIILAHNAMQVFDKLGFKGEITQLGNSLTSINITTNKFQTINRIETLYFDEKYAVKSVAIQRGVLQHFLINKLKNNCITFNKKVVDVKQGNKTTILFSDGDQIECDAVIAADGINSVVRNQLFKENEIRKPNQMCWRGISNITLPINFQSELNEMWGKGSRFGFVKISKNEVYWYGLHNSSQKLAKNDLLNSFKDYDPVVRKILSQTNFAKVFESEISDLKPISSWFDDNVCLLGDAAHATTPNLGQGACQAIEDAYAISYYISKYPINTAFSKYQQARKSKADMVVNLSWRFGILSQIKNPIISAFRNFVIKSIPSSYNLKQSEKIYTLPQL